MTTIAELDYNFRNVPDLTVLAVDLTSPYSIELPEELERWAETGFLDGEPLILVDPWYAASRRGARFTTEQYVAAFIRRYNFLTYNSAGVPRMQQELNAMLQCELRRMRQANALAEVDRLSDKVREAYAFAAALGDQVKDHAEEHSLCDSYERALDGLVADGVFGNSLLDTFKEAAARTHEVEVAVSVNITTNATVYLTVEKKSDQDVSEVIDDYSDTIEYLVSDTAGWDPYHSEFEVQEVWEN